MVWAGVGPLHVWLEIMLFDWALCIIWHIHSVSQSVSQDAAYFERFSTVVKHAESDSNSPCTVKIPGLSKVKGKSNQYVNRGSVNHTFPGRLCQDQLCIHHSLHDLCIQLKEEIKDRQGERQKRRQTCNNTYRQTYRVYKAVEGELVFDLWEGEKQSECPSEVWQLKSPICYRVKTSQQPTPTSSSVPALPPDAHPVKGWKVGRCLGGAERSVRVRFLRGQAVAVFRVKRVGRRWRWGGTIWLVSRAGDRRDHRAAVSPNQLHLWAMTDSHTRL